MSNWPRIMIDVDDGTWLVRSHPEGRILGSGKDGAAAEAIKAAKRLDEVLL